MGNQSRDLLLGMFALLALLLVQRAASESMMTGPEPPPRLATLERSIADIFERVSPSVVQISTITADRSNSGINIGSGFAHPLAGNAIIHLDREVRTA